MAKKSIIFVIIIGAFLGIFFLGAFLGIFFLAKTLIKDYNGFNQQNIPQKTTNEQVKDDVMNNIKVRVNNQDYNVIMENNATATAFIAMLPKEFNMHELNGNEKYIYMDVSLPSNSTNPQYINAGDIMLYGDDCLVVFYKSFKTAYSYTKIGHITNLVELDNQDAIIKFWIDS